VCHYTSIYEEWQKLERIGHMGHVREYTANELIEFVENFGFKLIKLEFTGVFEGKNSMPFEIARHISKKLSPTTSAYFMKVDECPE